MCGMKETQPFLIQPLVLRQAQQASQTLGMHHMNAALLRADSEGLRQQSWDTGLR